MLPCIIIEAVFMKVTSKLCWVMALDTARAEHHHRKVREPSRKPANNSDQKQPGDTLSRGGYNQVERAEYY